MEIETEFDALGNSELEGPGWYWFANGCYSGPFDSEAAAIANAQSEMGAS